MWFRRIILIALLTSYFLITSPSKAEWKIQLFLGKSFASKSDIGIQQPSRQTDLIFHDVKYNDASFETPLYYGLRVSYFPPGSPHLGLEAEFIHAKIYSDVRQLVYVSGIRRGQPIDSTIKLGDVIQGFSMSHGLNFLFFNLVGRVGIVKNNRSDKIGLCGRMGIGPLIPHSESVIEGESKAQYEFHGPAFQLAAGSEIDIWKKLNLLLEYKYTFVDVKAIKIPHGSAETKLKTSHLVFGVGRKF
jgi:hypothetical protein